MPTGRMNREQFFGQLATLDEQRLKKALWNLYWRGSAATRERIEAELDPAQHGRVKPPSEQPVDPHQVLEEVDEFVALARSGAYMAGDRRVSPRERTRWRLTFKRLVRDAQDGLRDRDATAAATALERLIDLACEGDYEYFHSEDPMEAAGFVVSDAVALLWATLQAHHGFAGFAQRAAPQLIRWERRHGWTRNGWGRVRRDPAPPFSPRAGRLRFVPGSPLSRRQFLATLGLSAVGLACGKGAKPDPPQPDGIDALKRGATEISVFPSVDTGNPVNPGKNRYAFGLVTNDGKSVISGGSPRVYVARDRTSRPLGPFGARWYEFSGYEKTADHSPKSVIPGNYVAEIDVPSAGNWLALVVAKGGATVQAGEAAFTVTTGPIIAGIGTKALSTPSPVATSSDKLKEICTRVPPDPMHAISLDEALSNGKPTVVSFATPLLCESMLCGPVVDEHLLVFERVGKDKANFIHVEEFLPGKDLTPPPATLENRSPAFAAWGFTSEPWVIVIDGKGIIRARMGPGPAVAAEIEAALNPLL